ncbi:MAG: beta-ketoacyl synthase N-terminal-like domain-containing protein, partial [Actinomycetota bacterium]
MRGSARRVAITGLGVVAPCGLGKEAFWKGLLGPGITDHKAIHIPDWDPLPYFDSPKDARRADRVEQMALAAAAEAMAQAGDLGIDSRRIGTIFGTGVGGLGTL